MTRIKLCGLTRPEDVEAANALRPEYIGFVFARKSRRYLSPREARALRALLAPGILAVGVFTDEAPETVAALLSGGVIDLAQLHGEEDEDYLARLRALTSRPLIQAFRVGTKADVAAAERSRAEHILLDAGAGSGQTFDWSLPGEAKRPYFLAGGLHPGNVGQALERLRPFGVDVSSGIETDGVKDPEKMRAFVGAVRERGPI